MKVTRQNLLIHLDGARLIKEGGVATGGVMEGEGECWGGGLEGGEGTENQRRACVAMGCVATRVDCGIVGDE